jgi:hypothetical protein
VKIYRKGQIVPKGIGYTCKPQRCRHLVVFGADVIVDKNKITVIGDGPAIYMKRSYTGGRHGKPRVTGAFRFTGIWVCNADVGFELKGS